MSKIKNLIIFLSSIVIIFIIVLVVYQKKFKTKYQNPANEIADEITYDYEETLQNVSIRNNYYIVKTCITKFYSYYESIYNTEEGYDIIDDEVRKSIELQKDESAKAVYNMLDSEYIKERGITQENILIKLDKVNSSQIEITDIYVSEKDNNMSIYFVYGNLMNKQTKKISNFSIIIEIDALNKTFSIFLQDYLNEKYDNLEIGDTIDIKIKNSIEKNRYNIYEYEHITDEEHVQNLFYQYKNELLYNQELAYNHLDKQFREKRFGTLEEFKIYLKNNIVENVTKELVKYKKTKSDQYTQYVCIDKDKRYYIFRETSPMKYTLLLDTYTIDIPEFVERYESSNDKEKTILNIQKFIDSINDKNYNYAYGCLADSFKNNYFKDIDAFKRYIENNFPNNFEVSYLTFEQVGEDYYTYLVKMSNGNNQISKTFIMKLGEKTNFELSFDV